MKEKLNLKTFKTTEEMIDWANSKDGTDYIISITFANNQWNIFYIK